MNAFLRDLARGEITLLVCGQMQTIDATSTYPWCYLRNRLLAELAEQDELREAGRDWLCQQLSHAGLYRLVNGRPTACEPGDLPSIPADCERIDLTDIGGWCEVSTVFLVLDHGFGHGQPQLYETMIFGGTLDTYRWRYATLGEAKQGHWQAVDLARRTRNIERRHGNGRKFKKWRKRMARFEALAKKRGSGWAMSHNQGVNDLFERMPRLGDYLPWL